MKGDDKIYELIKSRQYLNRQMESPYNKWKCQDKNWKLGNHSNDSK